MKGKDFRVSVVLAAVALAVAAAYLMLVGLPASAAQTKTLVVDDDKHQCPGARYTSIQSAVNAAASDDLISVCPGTYNESVTIDKSLTLTGDPNAVESVDCFKDTLDNSDVNPTKQAIVDPPDNGFSEAFRLGTDNGGNNIDLTGFVVQGASVGIDVSDRYSGYHVHDNLIWRNTLFGMDFGSHGERQSRVDHNCFRDPAVNSFTNKPSWGLVSELKDDSTWVLPSSLPPDLADAERARRKQEDVARDLINARIDHNSTFRNSAGLEAAGPGVHNQVTFENNVSRKDVDSIAIQNSVGSTIEGNQLSPTRYGIEVGGANPGTSTTPGLEITGNVVDRGPNASATSGIIFVGTNFFIDKFKDPTTNATDPTTYATVSWNTVKNQSSNAAIFAMAGAGLQDSYLLNNTVSGNGNAVTPISGIYLQSGNNDNELIGNTANNNTGNGILLQGNTHNHLLDNTANSNAFNGIALQALQGAITDTELRRNTVNENTLDGIVLQFSGNTKNDIVDNDADHNGRSGIHAGLGAIGNTFENNSMSTNGWNLNATGARVDARDDNPLVYDEQLNMWKLQNTWPNNACYTDFPAGYICTTS